MRRASFVLVGILVAGVGALAQDSTPSAAPLPQRDSAALAVIQQAVIALGGFKAAGQIANATVTGTIQPTSGSHLKAGTFVWIDAPPEIRYEVRTSDGTQVFASGHGYPANQRNAATMPLLQHMATAILPFHLPALVLARELQDTCYTIRLVGIGTVGGVPVVCVHISLDADPVSAMVTPQDWYFDTSSGLPVRVLHRLPDNHHADEYIREADDFSNFRAVNGLLVPFCMVSYEDEAPEATATINSVTFNTALSSTQFDLAVGEAQ
jgi:hypothetical protein